MSKKYLDTQTKAKKPRSSENNLMLVTLFTISTKFKLILVTNVWFVTRKGRSGNLGTPPQI